MLRTKGSLFWLLSLSLVTAFGLACPARAQQRTVEAGRFPGADLGAKINAADRALGAARADAFVGRMPAASTRAVTWAARPRAFQGAWRACVRSRFTGESEAMRQNKARRAGPG
jgi:hypothetical protein